MHDNHFLIEISSDSNEDQYTNLDEIILKSFDFFAKINLD